MMLKTASMINRWFKRLSRNSFLIRCRSMGDECWEAGLLHLLKFQLLPDTRTPLEAIYYFGLHSK